MFQDYIPLYLFTAAGTAKESGFAPPSGERWRVKSIQFTPNATLPADGTNYASVRAYVGTTAIMAARTTASSAFTIRTPEAFTLTGGPSDCEITSSSPFNVRVTHAGTGGAVDGNLIVTVERLNPALP